MRCAELRIDCLLAAMGEPVLASASGLGKLIVVCFAFYLTLNLSNNIISFSITPQPLIFCCKGGIMCMPTAARGGLDAGRINQQ